MKHDSYFHICMSYLPTAHDLVVPHLPEEYRQKCDEDSLRQENGVWGDKYLHHFQSDFVVSMDTTTGNGGKVFVLVEHQSSLDNLMPLRFLHYCSAIMMNNVEDQDKLPQVVPILLYQSKGAKYSARHILQECFTEQQLPSFFATRPFVLIDLSTMSDDEIMQHGLASAMMLVMKYVRQELDFMATLDKLPQVLEQLPEDPAKALLSYIASDGSTKSVAFFKALAERLDKHKGEAMKIKDLLIKEGKAEGRAEGKAEERQNIAKRLLQEGLPLDLIQRATTLSRDELQQLFAGTKQ